MSEALNREYHQLCGWRWMKGPHPYLAEKIGTGDYWEQPSGIGSNVLPPLHASADLCIAELDRVFPNGYQFTRGKRFEICVPWRTLPIGSIMPVDVEMIEQSGATFTEAALKCLIAAHKRDGGEK